jgi:hypothetical protein
MATEAREINKWSFKRGRDSYFLQKAKEKCPQNSLLMRDSTR